MKDMAQMNKNKLSSLNSAVLLNFPYCISQVKQSNFYFMYFVSISYLLSALEVTMLSALRNAQISKSPINSGSISNTYFLKVIVGTK